MVDAETGIRGYSITKESSFLEPYLEAEKLIPVSLNKLNLLTKDNPQQKQNLLEIERQIKNNLDLQNRILTLLKANSQNRDSNQLIELFTMGKTEMDLIRQSVARFEKEEWTLLDARQQHLAQVNKITNLAFFVSILTILSGYGLATILYLRSQKELEQKAQKLANTNQEMAEINQNLITSNQLLANRNEELDQFNYVVSHDLKAPLRGISNISIWIEEDLAGKIDEDTSNNLALLRSRIERMNNFIDGLLEYARASKQKEEKTTVDVQKLLYEIVDSIAPPPKFKIDINGKMSILQAETLLLQQVFVNLIGNAVKHHDSDNGVITITAKKQEQYYQFAVADDGAGIAPEHQEKIFGIFQTLSTRDNKENTGIGLSIVKKIVNGRGGKIWLESELKQGTTFYFTWSIN